MHIWTRNRPMKMLFKETLVRNALKSVDQKRPLTKNVTFSRQKKIAFAAEWSNWSGETQEIIWNSLIWKCCGIKFKVCTSSLISGYPCQIELISYEKIFVLWEICGNTLWISSQKGNHKKMQNVLFSKHYTEWFRFEWLRRSRELKKAFNRI